MSDDQHYQSPKSRGRVTHLSQNAMHVAIDMVGLVVLAATSARPDEPSATQPTLLQPCGILEPAPV